MKTMSTFKTLLNTIFFVEVFVFVSAHFQSFGYENKIFINPADLSSANTSACFNSTQQPCFDLNFALTFPQRSGSTIFILSSKVTHHLAYNASTLFVDSTQVAFVGDNGRAIVECESGAGLAFINSTNITINEVSFLYCGAWQNTTSIDVKYQGLRFLHIRVGLYFQNCRDVTMTHMSVSNSTEALGVMMYSTAGVNYIGYSQFENNRISENNKNDSGGGGFAVEFNYCKPGDTNCSESDHQTENIKNSIYTFECCSFTNNRGVDQSGGNKTDVSRLPAGNITHISVGRGGGLSFYISGEAFNNTIFVNTCSIEGNSGVWGGGLIVEITDSSIGNTVHILNSNFTNNNCYMSEGGAVGGVRIPSIVNYLSFFDKALQRNFVHLSQCTFSRNSAHMGGGVSLDYHLQGNSHKNQLFQVNVSYCTFNNNRARLGSAAMVDNSHYYAAGELGEAFFKGCNFSRNSMQESEAKPYRGGMGALYISVVQVTFEEYMNFDHNNNTALAILASSVVTLHRKTSLYFESNLGSNGGAMLLVLGNLIIGEFTNLTFRNNFAHISGGAIHNDYNGQDDVHSIQCFLQYADPSVPPNEWHTQFTFSGNRAQSQLGHSIFSTSVLPCSLSPYVETEHVAVENFCWNSSIWVYENSTCANEISTSARKFELSHAVSDIFPGFSFRLNITAKDEFDREVTHNTIYSAYTNTTTAQVDPRFTYVANEELIMTGAENQEVNLDLRTVSTSDWHIELKLNMNKCPPGFKPQYYGDISNTTCECLTVEGSESRYTYGGNLYCDINKLASKIRNHFWLGYISNIPELIDNNTLYLGATPYVLGSDSDRDMFLISQFDRELDKSLCSSFNRRGQLCGECLDNYSTAVNSYSYECVPCSSNTTSFAGNIFAYLGLTYLPYLIVFVVIIYFDIRLMSGPLVGFILYAQLISSAVITLDVISLPQNATTTTLLAQKVYRTLYGVFNLNSFSDLLHPICIHENFTALDVICLDYVVALFPLLLILVIRLCLILQNIKLCQSNRRNYSKISSIVKSINKKATRPLIHPFVSFIYLSYAKLTLTSMRLLTTSTIIEHDGSEVARVKLVYYAGQYYFGQKEFIFPYGFIAILTFTMISFLLPLLLLGPLDFVNWLIDKPRFNFLGRYWPTVKINIFLDAFQSSYKPNCRYFAGIYFLYRLIIFLIYALVDNEIDKRIWSIVITFSLIILIAWKKPYRIKFLNYLDCLLLCNLLLINLLSIHMYTSYLSNVATKYQVDIYITGIFFLWFPMAYFIFYLCWLALHGTKCCDSINARLKPLTNCLYLFFGEETLKEEQQLHDPVKHKRIFEIDRDTALFNRAEERQPRHKISTLHVSVSGRAIQGFANARLEEDVAENSESRDTTD